MKTMIIAIASVIAGLTASGNVKAQNTTVYYTPVTTNMAVGLGFDFGSRQCTLSVIEESKSSVDFGFDIIGNEGESLMTQKLGEGSVNVMPKSGNENYYQCNYTLSVDELFGLLRTAREGNKVVINGTQVSNDVLASAIMNIHGEMRPAQPRPLILWPGRYIMPVPTHPRG